MKRCCLEEAGPLWCCGVSLLSLPQASCNISLRDQSLLVVFPKCRDVVPLSWLGCCQKRGFLASSPTQEALRSFPYRKLSQGAKEASLADRTDGIPLGMNVDSTPVCDSHLLDRGHGRVARRTASGLLSTCYSCTSTTLLLVRTMTGLLTSQFPICVMGMVPNRRDCGAQD